jgi:hypothetical protein
MPVQLDTHTWQARVTAEPAVSAGIFGAVIAGRIGQVWDHLLTDGTSVNRVFDRCVHAGSRL